MGCIATAHLIEYMITYPFYFKMKEKIIYLPPKMVGERLFSLIK